MRNKNVFIEFYRFFFSLAIALHHFRAFDASMPYGGGYLAVDFFLVVSGFFLIDSLNKRHVALTSFAITRYLRLWKEYIVIFLVSLLGESLILGMTFKGEIPRYVSEALMLGIYSNASADCVIPAGWYCGYLVWGTIIFCTLFMICKKYFFHACGAITVTFYVILFFFKNSLCVYPQDSCFFDVWTLLRILAGLALGGFLHEMLTKTRFRINKQLGVAVMTLGLLVLAYSLLWDCGFNRWDYIKLLVFTIVFIVAVLIEKEFEFHEPVQKIVCYAGDISYTLFLSHFMVVRAFCIKGTSLHILDWKLVSIMYLTIAVIIAIFLNLFINVFSKRFIKK